MAREREREKDVGNKLKCCYKTFLFVLNKVGIKY